MADALSRLFPARDNILADNEEIQNNGRLIRRQQTEISRRLVNAKVEFHKPNYKLENPNKLNKRKYMLKTVLLIGMH